jgi:hypothetical protein
LRISKLREHFPRVPVVEGSLPAGASCTGSCVFADVLLQRGGFDLILGNPPWLKVEWNESGVLGEFNPHVCHPQNQRHRVDEKARAKPSHATPACKLPGPVSWKRPKVHRTF